MQFLYLIRCEEFEYFKIGIAANIEDRLAQLSTGNPFVLKVEAVYGFDSAEPVERSIHQLFKRKRVRGEWFALDKNQVEQFIHLCQALGGVPADGHQPKVPSERQIEKAEQDNYRIENIKRTLANGEVKIYQQLRRRGKDRGYAGMYRGK